MQSNVMLWFSFQDCKQCRPRWLMYQTWQFCLQAPAQPQQWSPIVPIMAILPTNTCATATVVANCTRHGNPAFKHLHNSDSGCQWCSSGLPHQKAPVMITEKPQLLFSFRACESCIVQPAVVALAKKVYLLVFVVKYVNWPPRCQLQIAR